MAASSDNDIADFDLARTGTKLAVLFKNRASGALKPEILDLSVPGNPTSEKIQRATHHVPRQRYKLSDESGTAEFNFNDRDDRPTERDQPTEQIAAPAELQLSFNQACASLSPQGPESRSVRKKLKLYRLQAEPHLYAPIIEFASGETVFPTETNIWNILSDSPPSLMTWESPPKHSRHSSTDQTQEAFPDKYLRMTDQRKRELGAVYFYNDRKLLHPARRIPGSWVFEYWTYYPFDVGHVGNHPHDTEHVFVEVDKLGGRVVGVLAAAHSIVTPNNLYSAIQPDAEPLRLPLAVMSEKGKHALAPDINRDLDFTPGLDVNVLSQYSQVWGVRDAIGQSDAHMLAYEASMTLPRSWSDAWAVDDFEKYFDLAPFPGLRPNYKLAPFPSRNATASTAPAGPAPASPIAAGPPPASREPARLVPASLVLASPEPAISAPASSIPASREAASPSPASSTDHSSTKVFTEGYADDLLNKHEDFRNPTNIYKPYVFPFRMVRVGVGNIEGTTVTPGSNSVVSIEYVNDLTHLLGLERFVKAPLPGRLAFQFMVGTASAQSYLLTYPPGCQPVACPPVSVGSAGPQSGVRFYYGGQYENSITNLFGYYFGYLIRTNALYPPHCKPEGLSTCRNLPVGNQYTLGLRNESIGLFGLYFDIPRYRNLTLQVGPIFAYPSGTSGVWYRLSVSVWQWRGRDTFGNTPTH